MTENLLFEPRIICPVCGESDSETLRKIAYTDSPVWDFVEGYYQGACIEGRYGWGGL